MPMTLSIAAIAGPAPASPLRTTAPAGAFALSLAQVAGAPVSGDDDPPPVTDTKGKDDARQDDAADGNGLPGQPDPSLLAAWLAPLPTPVATDDAPVAAGSAAHTGPASLSAPPTPAPATLPGDPGAATAAISSTPLPGPAIVAAGVAIAPASSPPPALPSALAASGPPAPPPPTISAIAALAAPVSPTGVTIAAVQAPGTTEPIAATPVPDQTPTARALRIDTRAAPVVALQPAQTPPPQPGETAAATTTSAMQAFGSAMRAGLKEAPAVTADGTTMLTGPAHAAATPAVAATGDAQQAPLDLRRENWPHAMIDRIEALRDAADASSTKIRVVPDALGPIEMSVRKDGHTVHVHFAADQAQTRSLLTDAQPRLAQIAEQRGLRLGNSTVDAGSGGAGQQQQQQQQAATPRPVAPAPSPILPAATAGDDDTRIA